MTRTASTDVWPAAHAERAALAADLTDLTDEQWAAPSLCAGWSVREVLAHLTAATLGPAAWMWSVLRSRVDFDRHNAGRLAEQLGADRPRPTPASCASRPAGRRRSVRRRPGWAR